jgi:DNA-binding MarR family transcriptional regulator
VNCGYPARLINSTIVEMSSSGGGKMEDKEQMVLDAMKKAGKPLRPGQVADLVGLAKDEVSKIIRGLKKKGKVTSPKRCFYAPA